MAYEILERGNIQLISFIKLDKASLLEILSWRNHEEIRKQMNTTDIIAEERHLIFVESLKRREDLIYWLIERKGKRCGVVYLINKSTRFTVAEWGFYAAPGFLGTGIGFEMAYECIKLFFEEIGVQKLHGYIKETNYENLRLQQVIGFKTLGIIKKDGVTLVDTALTERLPEETFKIFQKRLLHERKSKSDFI
jgi:UDP-4-amino-4,6-dideoxy-N-acetyl-beta-L-altrosamine N-acetyltransferase